MRRQSVALCSGLLACTVAATSCALLPGQRHGPRPEAEALPEIIRRALTQAARREQGLGAISLDDGALCLVGRHGSQWTSGAGQDGGKTWSETKLEPPFADGAYASVERAQGMYHAVWIDRRRREGPQGATEMVGRACYARSTDGSEWGAKAIVSSLTVAYEGMRLAWPRYALNDDSVHVLFARPAATGAGLPSLVYRRSVDKGQGWLPEEPIARRIAAFDVACDGDAVVLAWLDVSGALYWRRSPDNGRSWSPVRRRPPTGGRAFHRGLSIVARGEVLHVLLEATTSVQDPEALVVDPRFPEDPTRMVFPIRPMILRTRRSYVRVAGRHESSAQLSCRDRRYRPRRARPRALPAFLGARADWQLRLFQHGGSLHIVEWTGPQEFTYWQSKDDGRTWSEPGLFRAGP